ncbi:MAG: hypothetical protein QM640_14995 [Niabella sp.]
MKFVNHTLSLFFFIICCAGANAQSTDPEFRNGWLLNAKLTNGVITDFKGSSADLYAGGVSVNPQFTVAENVLRIGVNAGAVYGNKKVSGMVGPMAAIKLKTFTAAEFGSVANMHLILEGNWGTNRQQIAGGGFGFEILKLAHIGITAQRDYHLNSWWLQSFIAIRLNRIKYSGDDYSR